MKILIILTALLLSACVDQKRSSNEEIKKINRYAFVTSQSYKIDEIGGFFGASDICNAHAQTNSLLSDKKFIAYISAEMPIQDLIETIPDSVNAYFLFTMPNGEFLTLSKSMKINSKFHNFDVSESGEIIQDLGHVYINTDKYGNFIPETGCFGFTAPTPFQNVIVFDRDGDRDSSFVESQCDTADHRLFCVQQGD